MNKHLVDIIEGLVNELTFTVTINNCTVADGKLTLEVCNTYHLVFGSKITIGETDYKVLSVENNESITISGTTCPVETELSVKSPNYFHGTVIAANSEMSKISNSDNIVPISYLYEVLKEKRSRNYKSVIDRESTIQMFFLEDANFEDWLTDDHYKNVIGAMDNLAESFVDLVSERMYYGDPFDYNIFPHAKFGIVDKKGHIKNVFDRDLSGVELIIPIRLFKDCKCKECK